MHVCVPDIRRPTHASATSQWVSAGEIRDPRAQKETGGILFIPAMVGIIAPYILADTLIASY